MNSEKSSKLIIFIFIAYLAMSIIGCGLLNEEKQLNPELSMQIISKEISQGESFDVQLNVKNPSNETLSIKTSCKEFALLLTYKENKRINFVGNNSGCLRKMNTYELPPNTTLSFSWEMNSSITSWNQETASTDTTLAPPGNYLMQLRIHVWRINGQEYNIDDMKQTLTIR